MNVDEPADLHAPVESISEGHTPFDTYLPPPEYSPVPDSPTHSLESEHASKRARVDDVEDEDNLPAGQFCEHFSDPAATVIGAAKTDFELHRDGMNATDSMPFSPFADEEEWELSEWLMKNLGQNCIDEYLSLPITRNRTQPSFHNTRAFLQKIDELPTGPEWTCKKVCVMGNLTGEDDQPLTEELELWTRDPLEYHAGSCHIYNEMWTGDWWWQTQEKLPNGAVIAPVILALDKTKLSQFHGDKSVWPVYLTIGNISKETRCASSSRAMILIGYLPVTKLTCFSDKSRSLAGYCLFHHCMSLLLVPLVDAATNGVDMVCTDTFICRVFPIVASYVADYPEQCLVACCSENSCPWCTVDPKRCGKLLDTLEWCDPEETYETLQKQKNGLQPAVFEEENLCAMYKPFWHDLPHCNIFSCFTPDLLHQLHKGVFKDHLVSWCMTLVSEKEMDACFKALAGYPELRHFKKGVSIVTQWTGTEHKEMQCVFVALLVGAVPPKVLTVVRVLLDFIYLAQFCLHTSTSLARLDTCLKLFHEHKDVLIDFKVHMHFNISKLHSLQHYVNAIQLYGMADSFNTELPERLHIDYAKEAYRASNRCDYEEQMALWLQRQEAIFR
ncbi:hypothetical protein SCP_0602520 [Sparassis crispa]|uniref:CxC2-like cysteine cluster KDZ transposase-associated domain-containing protein n=1 Tax=Sparassis crispa TaxID=139825 RepID=A0A401GRC8_9APHY|nr:hypothetical protein SCP_0602520 [Sparassis crispa]GBE84274.1 hypothetical protein SCP_0602520 [Sparassis crispa]